MDEYFEVLDESGEETGIKKLRSEVHRDGDWHASVHVWVVSGRDVLLQKRSVTKESCPGCYDISASGHVEFGEHTMVAASRELYEETGIAVEPIEFDPITVQTLVIEDKEKNFCSREFNHVYAIFYTPEHPETRITEPDEIEELIWMDIDMLGDELKRKNSLYCIPLSEWEAVKAFRG